MPEAERVSGLVQVGLVHVAVNVGIAARPIRADVDGGAGHVARAVVVPIGDGDPAAVVIIGDLRGTIGEAEGDVADLVPRVQRRDGERLLGRGQSGDVDRDRVAVPVVGVTAFAVPDEVSGRQIVRELRNCSEWLCHDRTLFSIFTSGPEDGCSGPRTSSCEYQVNCAIAFVDGHVCAAIRASQTCKMTGWRRSSSPFNA
jgi:hypothetical protein